MSRSSPTESSWACRECIFLSVENKLCLNTARYDAAKKWKTSSYDDELPVGQTHAAIPNVRCGFRQRKNYEQIV